MSDTESAKWHRTSPLAALFFMGRIVEAIAKNAVQSFAPLAAFIFAYQGDLKTAIILGVSAFVIVTLLIAFLRYWFFRYQIRDSSILVRDGVLKKTQLDIKYDRIQAINTQQNVVFRRFGLTTVRFDTAGSSQQEGYLPAVRVELAEQLREQIAGTRRDRDDPDAADDADVVEEAATTSLLQLSGWDVVKVGLSSNRALIFLAFMAPLIEPAIEAYRGRVDDEAVIDAASQAADVGLAQGLLIALAVVVGIVSILMLASVIGAFLRYHRFELHTDGESFNSTGGLFTRHEHSIRFPKIQTLRISQNIVQRRFRAFRMRAKQAASGRTGTDKSFIVPHLDGDRVEALARHTFGDEFADVTLDPTAPGFERIAPQFLRSRTMLIGALPAVGVASILSTVAGWYAMWLLLWVPLVFLVVLRVYRRYGVMIRNDGLAVRQGFLGYRVVAHLFRKVQRVSVSQSPFQRRKGLATVRLYLASGNVRIPYVPHAKAQMLRDYILYKVEASDRAWH